MTATAVIDEALLGAHRRFEDPGGRYVEEFIQPLIGGGRTVAVLSRPTGAARPYAWVMCHSFGLEQINLGRTEVLAARALASEGFPVLRYHGQGYGDSETDPEITLSSHLRDAGDAVTVMRSLSGAPGVGVFGLRFGALVAALLADREELPFMALCDPVSSGSRYVRDLLRTQVFTDLATAPGGEHAREVAQLRERLAAAGEIDLKGLRLTRQAVEEIAAVDLTSNVGRFRGRALLLGVSRQPRIDARVERLGQHLRGLGCDCSEEVVQHALAARFGQHPFANDGRDKKVDVQLSVGERVASVVAAWAVEKLAHEPGDPLGDG